MFLGYIVYCRVGVVFCGRQSPGGHNVVWGLYDAIKAHNRKSVLLGFVGTYTVVNLCLRSFLFLIFNEPFIIWLNAMCIQQTLQILPTALQI